MVIQKVTAGFVIQNFDTDKQEFVSQEFVAGDQVDYEIDGDAIGESDFDDRLISHSGYLHFEMVQPGK